MWSTLELVAGALLLGVLLSPNVTGQDRAGGRAADEEAIRKVLADYVETWNEHDMNAWGKPS